MVSGLFGTLRQGGYALGFAVIASLFTVIQTSFELNWAYASLERLPGDIAGQMSAVFHGGGIWSPELLIFILRVAVLVCTAILGVSLLNSLPRVRMNWRRQFAGAGTLAAAAAAGTYALAVLVPGGLAVTAAEREAIAPAAEAPAVRAFGMERRTVNVQMQVPEAAANAAAPFGQYCAACHGAAGEGIPGLGVNLRESAFVRAATTAELKAFLRVGRDTANPANRTGRAMPAFGWMPDEALDQVVSAIREPADLPGT